MPIALITGAAKRIGATIALELAKSGFDIALHVNSSVAEANDLLVKIREIGVRGELFQLDLNEISSIKSMFEEITDRLGAPHLVVNNASVFEFDRASDLNLEIAESALRVNLLAPVEICRQFANHCDGEGLVVNMLDNKVFQLNPDFFSYTLSKIGLKGATEMLAMEYAGKLRVNGIAPGVTLISGDQTHENFEKSWQKSLSGLGATPEEIANTILYMWKTQSINGEIIVLDGGQRHMHLERDVAFVVE